MLQPGTQIGRYKIHHRRGRGGMGTMTVRRGVPRAVALAGGALLLLASTASAQDQAFKDGLDARDDKRWPVVVERMRAAIEEQRLESVRKVGGRLRGILGGGTEYFPYYFLGEALFNLNDCPGAVEAWAESEQQGAIKSRPELVARVRQGYTTCESRGILSPEKFAPMLQRTTQQVTEASAAATAFIATTQANPDAWRAEGTLREQYDRAFAEVQSARTKLASATRSRSQRDFSEASAAADTAKTTLAALDTSFSGVIRARAQVAQQIKEVEQQIAGAETLERSVEGRGQLTGPMNGALQQGREALARARDRLSAGSRTANTRLLDEARLAATDAAGRFNSLMVELERVERTAGERRLATALQAARETFTFVDGALATYDRLAAERTASVSADMTVSRQAVQRQVEAARRRLETSRKASDAPGVEAAVRAAGAARTSLDSLIGLFGPPTLADRGVHPALQDGARFFFSGDYQAALTALAADRLPGEVPLQLHVHLFRAASLFALHARGGGGDESLLSRARSEVDQCKALNPEFRPDPRAFSPRFLAFFDNASGSARGPAGAGRP
jgi:hypothetical protein